MRVPTRRTRFVFGKTESALQSLKRISETERRFVLGFRRTRNFENSRFGISFMKPVSLDLYTLAFVLMLVTAFLSASMCFIWRVQRTYPGFGLWTLAGFFLFGAARSRARIFDHHFGQLFRRRQQFIVSRGQPQVSRTQRQPPILLCFDCALRALDGVFHIF